jgi:predicted aminopeptidase
MKKEALEEFRNRYAALKAAWSGPAGSTAGYDRWVAQANNASFGAQAAYDDLVPAFEALFARQGGDWRAFYDEVRRLARLPEDERDKILALR